VIKKMVAKNPTDKETKARMIKMDNAFKQLHESAKEFSKDIWKLLFK